MSNQLHAEALLYAGKARTMAAKLFNEPQASQVDAGDLLLYMAQLVDQLCLATAPAAPALNLRDPAVQKRLAAQWGFAAAPAAPAPLTDEQIEAIGHRKAWRYKHSSDPAHSSTYTFNRVCLLDFARAAIEASKGEPRGWVCGKCGTDRTKAACPKGHSAALTGDCPMTAKASKGGADAA